MRAALTVATLVCLLVMAVDARTPRHLPAGADGGVEAAVRSVRLSEETTIADQVRLCEVPAPSFGEQARATVVRDMLNAAGLISTRFDRVGNVIGERPGRSSRPNLVLAAHLDTVFPQG